jgi:hypothetical protein
MTPVLLVLALVAGAGAPPRQTYIVELERPAAAVEFSRQATKSRGEAVQLDATDPALREYVAGLDREREAVLSSASGMLKHGASPRFVYRYALNGFAIELDADEAQSLARTPGVRSVQVERRHTLLTYGSADFVGASAAWNAVGSATGSRGEGIVVGVIDTGTNYSHRAFSATDVDGYRHVNPRGRYYGICAPPTNIAACNDKRIGVYDFSSASGDGVDSNGHGSHVSATAVGNPRVYTFSGPTNVVTRMTGVAPRANLISYKVVTAGSAADSSVIMALEQAVLDQVDVISWSLGYAPTDPWAALAGDADTASAKAVTNVVRAGIAFAASAGNSGPGARFGGPAALPWVASVGSSTSDRMVGASLTGLTGDVPAPAPQFPGAGIGAAYGPARIVLGAQFGSAECATGSDPDLNASGISNPFVGRVFNGEIVVCERGFHSRASKVANAKLAGAGGVILVNSAELGDTFVADAYQLPSVQIGYAAGQQLTAWVSASGTSANGRISAYGVQQSPSFGPVLSSFSSHGPDLGRIFMLRPSLTAPGQNIYAASHEGSTEVAKSGTSMAAPHVAGMLALLRQARRNENPLTLISALELTADGNVRINPTGRTATPIEQGAGSARVDRALQAGLVLPLTMADFDRENPRSGGDPSRLNTAALFDESCIDTCSFTRTVRAWRAGSYSASASIDAGASIAVTPAQFTLAAGAEQTLTITVGVSDARWYERFAFGAVNIVASDASIPASRMTVSARKPLASYPAALELEIDADRGSVDVPMTGRSDGGEIRFSVQGPVAATRVTPTLAPGARIVYWTQLTSPGEVRAQITDSTARDWDLYVGIDLDGDQQVDTGETQCSSLSLTNVEECRLTNVPAGNYFVLVLAYGSPNASDTGTAHFAAMPYLSTVEKRGHATGPSRLKVDQAFAMRLGYELGGLKSGERAYGAVQLVRGHDAGVFAELPLTLRRTAVATPAAFYLPAGESRRFLVPAGGDLDHLVVDVPAGATSLTVELRGIEGNASLYLAKAPGSDVGLNLPAAPALSAAAASADTTGSNETLVLAAPQLTPGRWYVVARNPGAAAISVDVTARLTGNEIAAFAYEVWYNPARDGSGLFFSRAGSTAQMVWYSYDDAGQPTWYLAFPDALTTNSGSVTTDLYRYVWAAGGAHGTRVGRATLTRQSGRLLYSWEVDGQSRSESMLLLTNSSCVAGPAGNFDPSGLWFEPARSGYGANLFTRPEVDFIVLYLYGDDGRARWLLGQNPAFGSAPLTLYQYAGYCPTCAATAVTRQAVGTFTRSFDLSPVAGAEVSGRWSIAANFLSPLAGAWNADNTAAQLLTARKACSP